MDCGSNTFRLVVFEYRHGGPFRLVDEVREAVRISAGERDGVLAEPALERAERAARLFAAAIRGSRADEVVAVATSAIRDARNRDEALGRLADAGLPVRVIDERTETRAGYLGAVNSTTLRDGGVLDIGGGSLQIAEVRNRRLGEGISRPLGAVRMTERFLTDAPTTRRQVKALQRHVAEVLADAPWLEGLGGRFVGIGGAIRTLARIDQKRIGYPLDELHGYVLTTDALDEVAELIRTRSSAERRRLPGLKSDRSDIMLAGAVVAREALRIADVDRIEVCGQGLREGLFYERLLAPEDPPLIGDVRRASVRNLAALYGYDRPHAEHVAALASTLHAAIARLDLVSDDQWEREMLWAAGILHDTGTLVDYNDHHKHGHYLVMGAGLPGFDHRELAIVALLVRSHRKRMRAPGALGALLVADDKGRLARMAACLRLAEALERTRDQGVRDVSAERDGRGVALVLQVDGDPELPVWAAADDARVLGRTLGVEVRLRGEPAPAAARAIAPALSRPRA